jgi:SAM-dependent methyltransferase
MSLQDPHGVLEKFGRDILALSPRSREKWVRRSFEYWRARGFPYPEIDEVGIETEFAALSRIRASEVIIGGEAQVNTVGLRLANAFHPQMWEIRCHGRSAVDSFENDETLLKAIRKAYRFYPNRRCWNAQCIRSLMRFSHRSRVSNFRPSIARAIYERYSPEGGRVLDFSAGFGGRLLAALSLNRHYLGIDPSPRQVSGLLGMVERLCHLALGQATVYQNSAEDVLPQLPRNSFDLVFSSPPYYRTEQYGREHGQSWIRYGSYSEWREGFLAAVIDQGCRVLRPGGYFLLNVKDTLEWPIARDAKALFPRGFHSCPTIRYLLPAQPHRRSGLSHLYSGEPILVFRRPQMVRMAARRKKETP